MGNVKFWKHFPSIKGESESDYKSRVYAEIIVEDGKYTVSPALGGVLKICFFVCGESVFRALNFYGAPHGLMDGCGPRKGMEAEFCEWICDQRNNLLLPKIMYVQAIANLDTRTASALASLSAPENGGENAE